MKQEDAKKNHAAGKEVATLAGGCFWCLEAIFKEVMGIEKVVSGYSGGTTVNPSYAEVCSGVTGHAESIQLTYDPKKISFREIPGHFFLRARPDDAEQAGSRCWHPVPVGYLLS